MNWFDLLKAELVEPKTIVDVTTGKTSNDECCEEVIELMKSEENGQVRFGFNRRLDRTKPLSKDNWKQVSYTIDELMSDAQPQYDCDWLYEFIDQHSHVSPIMTSGTRYTPAKGSETGWQKRANKYAKYLKAWEDCLERKGTEGMPI